MSAARIYFNNIWLALSSIAIGMRITFKHLFVKNVTTQYPDVKRKLPERARNRLYVNMDDCIGCDQCAMACPVDCITIETIKSTPDVDLGTTSTGQKKRLHGLRYRHSEVLLLRTLCAAVPHGLYRHDRCVRIL